MLVPNKMLSRLQTEWLSGLLILLVSLAVSWSFALDLCQLVFQCGCTHLWSGAAAQCRRKIRARGVVCRCLPIRFKRGVHARSPTVATYTHIPFSAGVPVNDAPLDPSQVKLPEYDDPEATRPHED